MSAKDYKDLMISVLNLKLAEEEDLQSNEDYDNDFERGYIAGLHEAIRTLRASRFLVEETE